MARYYSNDIKSLHVVDAGVQAMSPVGRMFYMRLQAYTSNLFPLMIGLKVFHESVGERKRDKEKKKPTQTRTHRSKEH